MNTINFKKQRELDFLHEFKKTVKFNFKIIENNRECPDFIISYNNQNIGIEVTEYFIDLNDNYNKGSRLKSIESIEQSIINNALKYYIETSRQPLSVLVHYLPGLNLLNSDRDKISRVLCECLSNIEIDIWERINILEKYDSYNLSKYFNSVQVRRIPDTLENDWKNNKWGIRANISEKIIFEIIRNKENKLGEYKKITDYHWLLIVSDGMYPSSMVGISDKFNFKVESEFDKIFFLTYPEVRIFKLK